MMSGLEGAQLGLFLHLELPVYRWPLFQMVEFGVGLEHLVRLGKTVAHRWKRAGSGHGTNSSRSRA